MSAYIFFFLGVVCSDWLQRHPVCMLGTRRRNSVQCLFFWGQYPKLRCRLGSALCVQCYAVSGKRCWSCRLWTLALPARLPAASFTAHMFQTTTEADTGIYLHLVSRTKKRFCASKPFYCQDPVCCILSSKKQSSCAWKSSACVWCRDGSGCCSLGSLHYW